MHIKRIQIEEGFLNGLDLTLTTGLNTVIGARGTGKTSLIELIRFCFDISSHLPETSRKTKDHALSVLDAGQVTITLQSDDQEVLISRSASERTPQASAAYKKPLIFSQTEIESIGLEPRGRLRLIDEFIEGRDQYALIGEQIIAKATSLSTQINVLTREINEIRDQLVQVANIDGELARVAEQEAEISKLSIELQIKTNHLKELIDRSAHATATEAGLQHVQNSVYSWYELTKKALDATPDQYDPTGVLDSHSEDLAKIRLLLNDATNEVSRLWHSIDSRKREAEKSKLELDAVSRAARQEIEGMQAGAGQIMRHAQGLREKKAKALATEELLHLKLSALNQLYAQRSAELDKLDELRDARFSERKKVCEDLSSRLSPNIRLVVQRNGHALAFSSVLAELLRGSGLKYGEISTLIAKAMSPRMLIEAIEKFDIDLLSDSAAISPERSSKVLSHLRSSDLAPLIAVDVDDEVSMYLLDGNDYKHITELSTGQRCTVILPIILAHTNQVVIVDQPEDHIDNAFIANTLIKAILARKNVGQIIFTTHNPNIPVLGDAEYVIQLASDGRRGFANSSGKLADCSVVEAISTVMEGGAAAFAKRAKFYDENLL